MTQFRDQSGEEGCVVQAGALGGWVVIVLGVFWGPGRSVIFFWMRCVGRQAKQWKDPLKFPAGRHVREVPYRLSNKSVER